MKKTLFLAATLCLWGCAGGGAESVAGPVTGQSSGGKTDTLIPEESMGEGTMGGTSAALDPSAAGGASDAPAPEDPDMGGNDGEMGVGGTAEMGGADDMDDENPEVMPAGGAEAPEGGAEGVEEPMDDPFAQALDVNLHRIEFPEGTPAPASYLRPRVETNFSLGGTEFWQQWPNGHMPTYSYSEGTAAGQRCMYASARRFEAIMNDPPAAIVTLREESEWRGSFFNWNDDFTESEFSDGRSARLWAWRTHLIKWISQTNSDGTCFLPTYDMVQRAGEECLLRAQRSNGEIQGCRAQ